MPKDSVSLPIKQKLMKQGRGIFWSNLFTEQPRKVVLIYSSQTWPELQSLLAIMLVEM